MLRINNYRVAKYLRLSRDDGDDRESESIENQRDIIENYINEHENLVDVQEYIDDGYTGTNFNRPGFKQMIQDIEDGKIDCIITKDLSRFGRDHIDTGYYLERYLPTKAIRYIAIGDNVDTINPDGLQFLTFKLSFNDYYAQDISNKIKSVKQRKIEKGEFQGGIPPYGYKKDQNIKNHLVPDIEASKIVQDIFDMYVNKGMGTTRIAKELNDKKIIPPGIYLKIPTIMKNQDKSIETYKWEKGQISKMLKNEVYIGNVVGRKFQKVRHKVNKVRLTSQEEHVIVENMHKAIIDIKIWNKAQEKISNYKKTRHGANEHPLKEFIYCAECGGKATYRIRRDKRKNGIVSESRFFVCSSKRSGRSDCKCLPIKLEKIEEKIKQAIKIELENINYTDEELLNIYKNTEKKINSKTVILQEQLKKLEQKLKENDSAMEEVYSDKLNKIICIDDFNKFYDKLQKEKKAILVEIHLIENKIQEISTENKQIDYRKIKEIANEVLLSKNPNREQYSKLIEKVEFDSQKKITVTFTFGHIEKPESMQEVI